MKGSSSKVLARTLAFVAAGALVIAAACESAKGPRPQNRVVRAERNEVTPPAADAAEVAGAPAPAEKPAEKQGLERRTNRPTRGGRTCVECHGEFMKTLEGKDAHFADLGARCEDCHDKHGLVGVLKLKTPEQELCLSCHKDDANFAASQTGGAALAHGGDPKLACTSCHDAHASSHPKLGLSAGTDLCFRCHDRGEYEAGNVHAPVKDGCLVCHDAHPNGREADLKAPVPELCAGCHDASKPEFKSAHSDYDLARSNCNSCHAPHHATEKGLLRRVAHEPMKEASCDMCHVAPEDVPAPSADAKDALATLPLVAPKDKLCSVCHGDKCNEFAERAGPHAPVKAGQCTECHSAHATDHDKLLLAAPDATCAKCHDAKSNPTALAPKVPHRPFADGRCSDCHDAHGGADERLLKADEPDLCLSCHEGMKAVLERENVHAPAELCSTCHTGHGSDQPGLMRGPSSELCLRCHQDLAERLKNEKLHKPVALGHCLECHDPHAADGEKLLVKQGSALCIGCHEKVVSSASSKSSHPPVTKGECLTCHDPHSSPHDALSRKEPGELCASCHGLTAAAIAKAPVKHPPAAAGACLACHSAHHAPNEHLLAQSPRETCAACHREVLAETTQPGFSSHAPVRAGECTECHLPHASDHAGLAKKPVPELCIGCHDVKQEKFATAHQSMADATTNCSSCHAPHAAPGEGLFWPNRHVPFADKKCEECHAQK
ncbi:MAG: cytochrome c3 family protein [Planctomycetes bacterium]|nr:cytochrome c3 family protein [Planctomycetota bacterium]